MGFHYAMRLMIERLALAMLCMLTAGSAWAAGEQHQIDAPAAQLLSGVWQSEPSPRLNGPRAVGIWPGTAFLHALAATGEKPIKFSASGMPEGLKLDEETGIIAGRLDEPGEHTVKICATNAKGEARMPLHIVAGQSLALTPPMGWNSFDAYGDGVNEKEFLANAVWFKEHLQPLGYDTVVIDFRWWDPDSMTGKPCRQHLGAVVDPTDRFGRFQPAVARFPSVAAGQGFKPLADKVHRMGMKFGIHIMRGIPRYAVKANKRIADSPFTAADAAMPEGDPNRVCPWCVDMFGVRGNTPAGEAWYHSIVEQYAAWGVDFVKADDMSYLASCRPALPGSAQYAAAEITMLEKAIRTSGRSMVLSLSPGATPLAQARHVAVNANMWRISPDFWDDWRFLNRGLSLLMDWSRSGASGPGHWPDGDMLPVGTLSVGGSPAGPKRRTRYTPAEQVTQLTAWCMAPSPLMVGACLAECDQWTEKLLTNPEVLAVDQDPLGRSACRLQGGPDQLEVWTRQLEGGAVAVAIFNRTASTVQARFSLGALGLDSRIALRDLWLHKDLDAGQGPDGKIPPHGALMYLGRVPAKR